VTDLGSLGLWDLLLVVVVTAMGTALAYLHDPKLKALVLSLPFPFTLATMAVGRPVGITHLMGFIPLVAYTHGVRILHQRFRWPIVTAIAVSAVGYGVIGAVLAPVLPTSDTGFWIAAAAIFTAGLALFLTQSHVPEPGYRTPLPVWIKVPVIAAVITALVLVKHRLAGFVGLFPMVGVVGSYEARKSLRAMCTQMPVIIVTILPLIVVCRLAQDRLGLGRALVLAWVVFSAILVPVTKIHWQRRNP
jgi:hypothetical protein